MKAIPVTEAVGMVLGQDLTKIVRGQYKGSPFRKGHVIREEDIPLLLNMGKDRVRICQPEDNSIHENDAVGLLAKSLVSDETVSVSAPCEGKVKLTSTVFGLLKVDVGKVNKFNKIPGVAVATLHTDSLVQQGALVAAVKVIPLFLPTSTLERGTTLCIRKTITVRPVVPRRIGLVITGNEVFYGRIEDQFEDVIRSKLRPLGSPLIKSIVVPDDEEKIAAVMLELMKYCDVIFVTGGMAVDADDVTSAAVRRTGSKIIVYGTPVQPGAMFLLAYHRQTAILGIPACTMFHKTTILDVVLPKILAGERVTARYVAALGHGGLCRSCDDGCHFPACSFCK